MTATGFGLALILLSLCCGAAGMRKSSKKLLYASGILGLAAMFYAALLIFVIRGM